MKQYLIFILLFANYLIYAQSNSEIDVLHQEAIQYLPKNIERSAEINTIATKASDRNRYEKGQCESQRIAALIFRKKGKNQLAYEHLKQALVIAQEIQDQEKELEIRIDFIALERRLGNFSIALEEGNYVIEVADSIQNHNFLAKAHINISNVFSNMGDAKKALNHSLLAVDFAEKSSDKNTYLKASYNLANRYYDEGEYELASNLYNETLNLSVENENKDIEAGAYEGLASIYYEQNDLEKVKIYYQKAREIYLQTQDSLMLVTNSRNIGFVEELLGNDLKALIQYQQAEKYLQNKGSITDHFDLMDLISSAYSRMGKYEEADTYKEKQLVMVDSLVTQMQTIEELKLKYTQEENKLQQQRQKQQTLIVSLILLAALITLSFLYYHHHQSKKFHELDKRQMELEAKERERQYRENLEQVFEEQEKKFMDAVLRQEKINNVASQKLHDHVGNTLLSVVWSMEDYLEQQKKNQQTSTFLEKTNKLLYDIYEEVRTVSHRIKDNHFKEGHLLTFDQTEAIATQELVGAIEDLYDKISGDRLQAKVYVSGDVQALDSTIEIKAYRIIQELTSNVLKHARATKLELQLNYLEDELQIILEDDGIGFQPERQQNGIGLRNINTTIEVLEGRWEIDSGKGGGTTIMIDLPANIQKVA